ncbi:CoA pyrophosphatase [Chloroflexi bacterium TSY]|nr:CoA pyrophosphatase [Chloroflexi bacterium TSY]
MNFLSFIEQLRRDLAESLPGQEAQYRMAPQPRTGGERNDRPGPVTRRSAVLLLFYLDADQIHLPLILRPTYSGVHSGQVGLPGGGYEKIDKDLIATALRETNEEIGVKVEQDQVLGQLTSLYINASDNLVHPVVAWTKTKPRFQIDRREVERLLLIPIHALQNPQNYRQEEWNLRNHTVFVPFFHIQGETIWGATAMILSELLALKSIHNRLNYPFNPLMAIP